jgi:hypothetical protein
MAASIMASASSAMDAMKISISMAAYQREI